MPVHKREDVIGYSVGSFVYCSKCFDRREDKRFDNVIEEDATEEYLYVCDECHEEIES